MQRYNTFLLLLTFITALYSSQNIAGPIVKLCLELDCKHPAKIEISDSTWSKVKDLYKAQFQSNKDEQDNIANSIALIEKDVFTTLAQHQATANNITNLKDIHRQARKTYYDIGIDNKHRNIKNYLALMLDKLLINRHFLRKTITLKSWAGIEKSAIVLQSLDNSQLYLLTIDDLNLGKTPVITSYNNNASTFDSTVIRKPSNTNTGK